MALNKTLYILIFGLLFSLAACKHKQKEVKSTAKKPIVSKQKETKKPNEHKPNDNEFGQKLGVSTKEIKSNKLYAFVNEWYGTPYKYGGCQKNGVDCSCFVSILCENVYNKVLPRTAVDMFKDCKKITLQDAKSGDLFFFKINGNNISHVGVFLTKNYFAHSSTSKGVVINSIEEAYYKKYFFCAGRINDI